jgi:hypothetical protein
MGGGWHRSAEEARRPGGDTVARRSVASHGDTTRRHGDKGCQAGADSRACRSTRRGGSGHQGGKGAGWATWPTWAAWTNGAAWPRQGGAAERSYWLEGVNSLIKFSTTTLKSTWLVSRAPHNQHKDEGYTSHEQSTRDAFCELPLERLKNPSQSPRSSHRQSTTSAWQSLLHQAV